MSKNTYNKLTKILLKELKDVKKNQKKIKGITATPEMTKIECDKDSLYSNEIFYVQLKFPKNYPFIAPKAKFLSKIFHPNISDDGEICIDILKENWSPIYSVTTLLLSLQQLIDDANPDSPLNIDAAIEYRKGRDHFKKILEKIKNSSNLKRPRSQSTFVKRSDRVTDFSPSIKRKGKRKVILRNKPRRCRAKTIATVFQNDTNKNFVFGGKNFFWSQDEANKNNNQNFLLFNFNNNITINGIENRNMEYKVEDKIENKNENKVIKEKNKYKIEEKIEDIIMEDNINNLDNTFDLVDFL